MRDLATLIVLLLGLAPHAVPALEIPSALKNGLGVDVPIGIHGNLHLTIHERQRPDRVGLRFVLRERNLNSRVATWSAGPVVKMMRCAEGSRHVTVIPQLRARFAVGPRSAYAWFHYGFWSTDGKHTPMAESTWQLQFQMAF